MYSHALKIVTRLVSHGHIAYFAGGWVRDLVMKHPSDDIDIATSASPAEILDLFSHTLLVGIQFGVVVVLIEGHPFEVATFRKDLEYKDGRKPGQIEQTSPRVDALRRDFTINGMFYDPLEDKIHDYVGGVEDIEKRVIRAIGFPYDRFFEDRLRMIRAFRFAARFDFRIDSETEQAIQENAPALFPSVAMERIWQEFCKMEEYPRFDWALLTMHRLKLLPVIFPDLSKVPLHEMERRLAPLKNYPKSPPQCLFLRELFPDLPREDVLDLGRYLKAPNKEVEILNFYMTNAPFDIALPAYSSVYFYASPHADVCLKIYAARLSEVEAPLFLKAHAEKKRSLEKHVQRLIEKSPLLSSRHLMEVGIQPGIEMGKLLKEGERLAIERNLDDKDAVLTLLNLCKK